MRPAISRRTGFLWWVAAIFSVLLLAAARWPAGAWLTTGFDTLLPATEQTRWLAEASRAMSASYSDKLIVLVRGPDRARAEAFQTRIAAQLVESGYAMPDFEAEQARRWAALAMALHPYRMNLVTAADRVSLEQDPERFLADYRRLLFSPLGGPFLNSLQADPAGLLRRFMQSAAPELPAVVGSAQEDAVAAELAIYRIPVERLEFRALAGLWNQYLELREVAAAQGFELHATGAPLYSAYGVFSGQREISTVGLVSLALLITLLLVVLRSPSALVLVLTCVASGVFSGLLVTVALLQQIHILTLVFGVTLIGIAADYAFHFLAHSLLPGWRPEDSLHHVWRSLTLGLISSALAFSLLILLPFPGLRQIGLFMAAGLLGSYFTVCLFFPFAYRGPPRRAIVPRWASWQPIEDRRAPGLLLLFAVLALPGLWLLQGRDDVRDFYAAPPSLRDADRVVIEVTQRQSGGRFFLLRADSAEHLLALEERLFAAASDLRREGRLGELYGISRLVPSAQTQRRNFELMRELLSAGSLAGHLEKLGLSPDDQQKILADWRSATGEGAFRPLDPGEVSGLDLPAGTGGFLGCADAGCGAWVNVAGSESLSVLRQLAESVPGVLVVDPVGDVNRLMQRNRLAVSGLLVIGMVMAALFLAVTGGWRRSLRISLLPCLACAFSLAVVGYTRGSYSIVHVLALMLVIGVSLDFAIFRELTPKERQSATTLAIGLSALTSVLAFGMLGLSKTPLIAGFGQTIATGLLVAWGLSWIRSGPEPHGQ